MKPTGRGRKLFIVTLAGTMGLTAPGFSSDWLVGHTPAVEAAAAPAGAQQTVQSLIKKEETYVTSGVKRYRYAWIGGVAQTEKPVYVLEIDLRNPYVKLDVMGGKGGSVTSRQTVGAMVRETGAVAGVNGDVFNMKGEGAPIGPEIRSGELYASPSRMQGMYAFGLTAGRKPVIDRFTFTGAVTAADGAQYELAGVNKASYRTEPDNGYSHYNALYLYTSAWTASQRPSDASTSPTEALVVDGIVTAVSPAKNTPLDITAIPENGYILRGHRDAADFILQHLKVGEPVSVSYQLVASDGTIYRDSDFQMLIGGHTILVENGKAAAFSRDISGVSGAYNRARTAVAYSRDGNTVWLITVEQSGGMTLKELQQVLVKLGAWKAVNLDGGGSTTMMARPLGEFDAVLVHPVADGTQRAVTNGIGVYTTAPKGAVKGVIPGGPQTLFIGQKAEYTLRAYDTYYNPLEPDGVATEWSLDQPIGTLQGNVLVPNRAGTAELTVRAGDASASIGLEVIGEAQLQALTVKADARQIGPGSTVALPVEAKLADGRTLAVPDESVQWELIGIRGRVTDGRLLVEGVDENADTVYAIARYDGYGTVAAFTPTAAGRVLEDFENMTYPVLFTGLPAETSGMAGVESGLYGREAVLWLAYDFTAGTGNRFAYAVLGDGIPLAAAGTPSGGPDPAALTLDVWGDGSNNWLRAEFRDASGQVKYVTLADRIDWSGWKTIRIDLQSEKVTAGMKLTRLYVVHQEKGQNGRALQGEIAFDNLVLQYPRDRKDVGEVVLKLGKAEAAIGGETVKLDVAPFQTNNTTFVPLRFISEALGGKATWDNQRKRVTVLRGGNMVELRADSPDMIVNGVRMSAPASPQLKNGRVMVPVRIIAEQLGLKVHWDQPTKTVTIRQDAE